LITFYLPTACPWLTTQQASGENWSFYFGSTQPESTYFQGCQEFQQWLAEHLQSKTGKNEEKNANLFLAQGKIISSLTWMVYNKKRYQSPLGLGRWKERWKVDFLPGHSQILDSRW